MKQNNNRRKKNPWFYLRTTQLKWLGYLLGAGCLIGFFWQFYLYAEHYLQQVKSPVSYHVFPQQLRYQDKHQLMSIIDEKIILGAWKTDVNQVRKSIQALPWIQHVVVNRRWFNQLNILITEHHPVVRWQNLEKTQFGFFTQQKGFFSPNDLSFSQELNSLPLLSSSTVAKKIVFEQWLWLKRFIETNNFKISYVTLDQYHAWRVKLRHGEQSLLLLLGRNNVKKRMQRFVNVFSTIRKINPLVNRFDLRYPNGVSTQTVQLSQQG